MKIPVHFLLLFFCGLSLSASAQWSVGLKGGLVRSGQDIPFEYLSADYQYTQSGGKRWGHAMAASFYYRLNKFLQIGMEPGIARKGSSLYQYGAYMIFDCGDFEGFDFEICDPVPIIEDRITAQYFQLPLFLKFNVGLLKNRLSLFAKGGGSASWLSAAYNESANLYIEFPTVATDLDLNEGSHLNRWDVGWHSGGGLGIKTGPGSIILETVFYQGFKDFYNYRASRTSGFEYSLGYQVNL